MLKRHNKTMNFETTALSKRGVVCQFQADLNQNIAQMKKLFDRDKTMITRRVTPPGWPEGAICLFFCDGMVNATSINENIIRPLTLMAPPAKGVDRLRYLEESGRADQRGTAER